MDLGRVARIASNLLCMGDGTRDERTRRNAGGWPLFTSMPRSLGGGDPAAELIEEVLQEDYRVILLWCFLGIHRRQHGDPLAIRRQVPLCCVVWKLGCPLPKLLLHRNWLWDAPFLSPAFITIETPASSLMTLALLNAPT